MNQEQALSMHLRFKYIGFKLLDTMIYAKTGVTLKTDIGYHSQFEFMFVFSKGRPKTFNGIKDVPVKNVGAVWTHIQETLRLVS